MIKVSRIFTARRPSPTILMRQIKKVLSPDLLKKKYIKDNEGNPTFGHCYAASEALYHLLGGREAGFKPVRAKDPNGITHWWIQGPSGEIYDPTAEQYTSQGDEPPYGKGKGGGFMTRNPSARATTILDRMGYELIDDPA